MKCDNCGCETPKNVHNQRYCPECRFALRRQAIPREPGNDLTVYYDPHPLPLEGKTFTLKQVQQAIKEGDVWKDGTLFKPHYRVRKGKLEQHRFFRGRVK